LISIFHFLLDRQLEGLALDFENKGGFTESLYRGCSEKIKKEIQA
jgi:four helix bundle suffix protein